MKNILVLGLSDSLFTRDFCTEVLNEKEMKVSILSPYYSKQYGDDYRQNNINEVKWPDFWAQGIRRYIGIRFVDKYISAMSKLKKEIGFGKQIDAIFVHYVEPVHILYFIYFWFKAKKRILVFWGDDILRVSDKKLKSLPIFLRQSTAIVFTTPNPCKYFQNKFGHKYDGKIHIVDFGNSILDKIDQVGSKYTAKQCKEKFGLPTDKVIVHVGYNAFRGQQHYDMMRNVVTWAQMPTSKEWVEKIKFVFHVSYGQGEDFDDYCNSLKLLMDQAALDYVFVEEYLQDERLAMFRKTCDIFLYGQITDTRSASPLEYAYAGAYFICPAWLKDNYELLDEGNVPYYVYDDFADLPNIFSKCLLEYMSKNTSNSTEENISLQGKKIIRDTTSWESVAPEWKSLY